MRGNWRVKIIIYAEEMFSAVEERLFVHRRVYRGTCNRERERERRALVRQGHKENGRRAPAYKGYILVRPPVNLKICF